MRLGTASLFRWLDLLLYSALGALAVVFVGLITSWLALADRFVRLSGGLRFLVLFGLAMLSLWPLMLVMRPSVRHLRHVVRYPPLYFAVVGGTFLAREGLRRLGGPRDSTSSWAIATAVMLVAMLLMGELQRWRHSLGQRTRAPRVKRPLPCCTDSRTTTDGLTPEIIVAWSCREQPVAGPEDDLFGHMDLARRLMRHFVEAAQSNASLGVGLIGPFGSGKTSVVQMLARLVAEREPQVPLIWVCRVSCWGFEDSAAALKHVLDQIVSCVDQHVESLTLRSMPAAYLQAFAASGTWPQILTDAFLLQPDPRQQLARLTPLLAAADAHLVLVIEDVDRNPARAFDPQDIQTLLYRLREVQRVSFLLTAGAAVRARLDFAKLCDHIEAMPAPRRDAVQTLLWSVRQSSLTEPAYLDPVSPRDRDAFGTILSLAFSEELAASPVFENVAREAFALQALTRNPRTLKHTVRRTLDAWNSLRGELDFDDLLIANIVRYGAPEAFDFLLEQMDRLRTGETIEPSESLAARRWQERRERLLAQWKAVTCDVEWQPQHAEALIVRLVPQAKPFFGDRPLSLDERLQGVQHADPTDYWRRLLAEELADGEVPDQQVLRLMRGLPTALAKQLVDHESFADKWEHLAANVDAVDLRALAEQVFDQLLDRFGPAIDGHHWAITVLWRRFRARDRGAGRTEWLVQQIGKVCRRSLALANQLYDPWANTEDFGEERELVRCGFVGAIRQAYTSGQALAAALSLANPYALRHCVLTADGKEPASLHRGGQDWRWLAPVILEAVHHAPDLVVVQLALLVGRFETQLMRGGLCKEYYLDELFLRDLFADRCREALALLSTELGAVPAELRAFISAAQVQAAELASRWSSSP